MCRKHVYNDVVLDNRHNNTARSTYNLKREPTIYDRLWIQPSRDRSLFFSVAIIDVHVDENILENLAL